MGQQSAHDFSTDDFSGNGIEYGSVELEASSTFDRSAEGCAIHRRIDEQPSLKLLRDEKMTPPGSNGAILEWDLRDSTSTHAWGRPRPAF